MAYSSLMAPSGVKVVASNRRARRDYEVLETVECGIALRGSEVKSLRESKVQLTDAHARFRDGELWLHGVHISPYGHAHGLDGHDPDRERKLLARRAELDRLRAKVDQDRLALVPLALYFKEGRAKVELALGRGRRTYDKRQAIAKREADLEARRAVVRAGRGE
ncbi:SsrA-binding protein SmpB [soil metagenome]